MNLTKSKKSTLSSKLKISVIKHETITQSNDNVIISTEQLQTPIINSKKSIIMLFLKDLLNNFVSARDITSYREQTERNTGSESTIDENVSVPEKYEADYTSFISFDSKPSKLGSDRTSEELERSNFDSFTKLEGNGPKLMKLNFSNGNYYEGEIDDFLMHGQGIYMWSDGTIYEGEFKNGFLTGKGKMILSELSTYDGEFCMGYFHGEGVLNVASTSIIYKGEWRNGKREGRGWISYGPDNWYEGNWIHNNKHGSGFRNYGRGVRYEGEWTHNKKNGQGRMLWNNNDYYEGQWKNNMQHGYGEYIWNLTLNTSFTFLIYNSYRGAWSEGKRTGIGLMDFGNENGAKLVGMWENDIKDGPGIMSCGNGVIVACNPLFQNDKPVHQGFIEFPEGSISEQNREFTKMVGNNLLRTVVTMIDRKEPIYQFSEDMLNEITDFSITIRDSLQTYSEYGDKQQMFCPLKISVNVVPEVVNLRYYIADVLAYFKNNYVKNFAGLQKTRPSLYATDYLAIISRAIPEYQPCVKKLYEKLLKSEENLLRNIILIHLPKLKEIYMLYAKLGNPETKTKPVLVRLFIWQLLRDIQFFHIVSLVESDLYFSNNPNSCAESDHNPFEAIYFWQFLQYLVGCSWLFYKKHTNKKSKLEGNLLAHLFREFLETEVFPNIGKFDGSALREHINTVPIKAVYKLYQSVGEPHSIQTFLNHTCTKYKKDPPCYFGRFTDTGGSQILEGYNAVSIGNHINFILTAITKPSENSSDKIMFRKTLFTFRTLGKRKIIKCLKEVYPNLEGKPNSINLDYKINFLEFYEILLICAIEKATMTRKAELNKIAANELNASFNKLKNAKKRRNTKTSGK